MGQQCCRGHLKFGGAEGDRKFHAPTGADLRTPFEEGHEPASAKVRPVVEVKSTVLPMRSTAVTTPLGVQGRLDSL
jgi:hypothetical protein